jgi:FkbM family methyltransferase
VGLAPALLQATWREQVDLDGLRLRIPGSLAIRASVLAGNVRMRAIVDRFVRPGDTVIDVGANIGAIAAYAAARVGSAGRVIALEPARDNLAVLRENVALNHLSNVTIVEAAAGRRHETRHFYQRGDVSAVNSLYPDSCYGAVTAVSKVEVLPLDDLVDGPAALVKIDVEGAELDVIAGMPQLLNDPQLVLVAEWHPVLQQAAGCAPDALPLTLLQAGFDIEAVGHLGSQYVTSSTIQGLGERLLARRSPVELLCYRRERLSPRT